MAQPAGGKHSPAARGGRQLWLAILLAAAAATDAVADTNVARSSRIVSQPYVGGTVSYLTDGRIGNGADATSMRDAPLPLRVAHTTPLVYEFTLPQTVPVTRLRLLQRATTARKPATGFVIEVDADASGRASRTIVAERNATSDRWMEYRLAPPIDARVVRFRATHFDNVSGPAYGAPVIEEFEIYTDAAARVSSPPGLAPAPYLATAADGKVPIAQAIRTGRPAREPFRRGVFGAFWLFWSVGNDYDERANDGKVAMLKRLNVNRYWLYPGVYAPVRSDDARITLPQRDDYLRYVQRQRANAGPSGTMAVLPFPNSVVPGYRRNVLGEFVRHLNANGIQVIANQSPLPIGIGSWDFPRVMEPRVYPSLLTSTFVREASTTLYRELMQAGVDGIAVGGDEFFLYGEAGRDELASPVCKDRLGRPTAACTPSFDELLERRFASRAASPRINVAARRQLLAYERLAQLFGHHARMMKTIDPAAIVTALLQPVQEDRVSFGVAYDLIGSLGEIDEMSSDPYWAHDSYLGHYYFASETKKLVAASASRRGVVTLQTTPAFDRNGYADPLMVYGPAFSSLMHGATGVNFYKHDYLHAGGRNDPARAVQAFFDLTVYLEQRDLSAYRVPRTVALVYSRATEDWWRLEHRADPMVAAEPTSYQHAVMDVLFRNGVAFDLYYADQPATLEALREYAIAILPFPYSLSWDAAAKLRDASAAGTKVVAINRLGEVDEVGEAHSAPVLRSAAAVRTLAIDLSKSSFAELSTRVMDVVREGSGDRLPLHFDAAGADVECATRARGDDRLIFCLNWERRDVEVNLGLALADGVYSATAIGLETAAPALIGGKSTLTADDLRRFRLGLAAGEARIVSVERRQKR